VAQRSLAAALKAKALAANPSALEYSRLGLTLLPDDAWEVDYDLTLGLHRAHAESLWRCGKADAAGRYLTELLNVTRIAPLDRLGLYHTLIEIDTTQGLIQKALHTCQEGLASVGVDFTMEPTDDQVLEVYRAYRSRLQNRVIESLLELPPLKDPLEKAAMDCMAAAIPAAILTSLNMGTYLCCKMVHSSLMHGTSHATAAAYSYFAMLLGPVFGEYEEAYRLGKVAYEFSQRETHFWKARIYVTFGNAVNFWTQPMRTDLPYVYAARPVAQEVGDVAGACFCCNHLISTLLALGQPLPDVDAEITRALEFLQAMNYPAIADILLGQQRLVRRLRADGEFNTDDIGYTTRVLSSPMTLLRCWYHTWNLQACYLLEKPDEALRAAEAAKPFLWSSRGHLEEVEYAFYHALTLAQVCTQASGAPRKAWLTELLAYGETWQEWAHNSPENFSARYHLIQAETARLMKEDLQAMHHYDEAIRLARQNSFIQVEALSYELASHFYERSGFQAFCNLYLQEARRCYEAWGATGKLRLLKDYCPHSSPVTGHGIQDSVHQSINIDRLSLLRATQSISSEIIPNQLIEKLMRLLVEASGAERGYLITSSEDTYHVRAGSETRAGQLQVEMFTACRAETFPHLPQTILNYVRRSRDKVLIADARAPHAFTSDAFLQHHPVKSILCLPILKHQVLIGMIYLENKFVAGAFTPSKLTALEIIASQAAISMENARLYDEL
ncbi:MAG: GAF domain-containing protein, partial [Pseudobdellovibrionaceae bacterium]|nr:GAF domain-containing protein [Pseudobdellovibrionaceae bacterium]